MMFDFDAMATFVAVVRSGSFARAATSLRLPRSTVSNRVARLEAMLGARLLERTTRVVRPTNIGAAYFERCSRILSEVEEANAAVADRGSVPRGRLRVAAPTLFAQLFLADIAGSFIQAYPEVEIEVVALDRPVNLVEEGFDVSIAVATADEDSSLIARKLPGGEMWCCAAPSYLKRHAAPCVPEDLAQHSCIALGGGYAEERWTFEREHDVRRVAVKARLTMNLPLMVLEAARAGAGVAPIQTFLAREDVSSGRLARVLSDWTVNRRTLRVVYPSARHLSLLVRRFVDAVVAGHGERIAP